jgi:hypothetical protein
MTMTDGGVGVSGEGGMFGIEEGMAELPPSSQAVFNVEEGMADLGPQVQPEGATVNPLTGAGAPAETPKIEEPKPEKPESYIQRQQEQKTARKRRRSLLGQEEEGLLAPANVYRRSLLG